MILVFKFPNERGRRGGFRFGEWNGAWDPEGLLSTLAAIGTCLLGVFAGLLLKEPRLQPHQKTLWLIGAGAAMIALGVASHVSIEPRRARRTVRKSQKPSACGPPSSSSPSHAAHQSPRARYRNRHGEPSASFGRGGSCRPDP
jgi:hypothetical protein